MKSKPLLVVEDDQDIRDSIEEFLVSEGYAVVSAANGHQALLLLRSLNELPKVILLDLMMPIMDGFRFREEQEKDVRLAPIPIVLMTADAHIEAKRLKIGAQAFIRKPIDIDELSLILKKF